MNYSYRAEEDAADTFLRDDGAPCLEVGFVELGVDLTTALDKIERCDGGVSGTASCGSWVSIGRDECLAGDSSTNDTAESASSEVVGTEQLDLLLGFRHGSHDV